MAEATAQNPEASGSTPMVDNLLETHKTLRVGDKEGLEKLLRTMKEEGLDNLQVITDFDSTMTKLKDKDGKILDDSWGMLERSPHLPDSFLKTFQELRDKYTPIEQDPDKTNAEKAPDMLAWTRQSIHGLVECKVTRALLTQMVKETDLEFRDEVNDFVKDLCKNGVPFLILSAGSGDLIKEILDQRGLMAHCNVHVASNYLNFDDKGLATGIRGGRILHVFNKNLGAVQDEQYKETLQKRKNVILMGDCVGDATMAEGIRNPGAIVKIGFLNANVDECLKEYLDTFNMVILEDPTMEVPRAVVEKISEEKGDPKSEKEDAAPAEDEKKEATAKSDKDVDGHEKPKN